MSIPFLRIIFFCVFISPTGYSQIFSPVLTDARLVARAEVKAGAGYSALGFSHDGKRSGYLNSLDFQGHYGLSDKVNLFLRYQHSWFASELFKEWALSYLFAGANISLLRDRISFFVPFGTRFSSSGDDDKYFELSPALLFSIPVTPAVAFNPSVELGFPFCKECTDTMISADFGLGIYPAKKLSLFVEYGLVYSLNSFNDGHYYMFSGGGAFKF